MRAISPGLEVAPHQYRHHSTNKNDPLPFKKEGSWRNWICIITITVTATALIVGGAVGGGLGASLASCRQNLGVVQSCDNSNSNQCENASPITTKDLPLTTTTSSAAFQTTTGGLLVNYKIEPPSKVFNISVDCDTLAGSIQVTQDQEKFLVYCGVDFGHGNRKDKNGNEIILADIIGIIAYSMDDCLEACSRYTYNSQLWGVNSSCGSVTLRVDMANTTKSNCWLKNSTITHSPGAGSCDVCIGATKIS
ncbi:hypothetical protein F4823DRAFT_396897 [Ustulina deusta]|nr:hypothetical protein F4823DRAFT_396897 [Ustulina deusta]